MSGRALKFPTRDRLVAGITGALVVSLAFFPIYVGGAASASGRAALHLYAGWELAIPFWPPMIAAYLSMFVLFVIPPLQLEPRELHDLAVRLVAASLIGGLIFFCLPSEVGFVERTDAGFWQPLYDRLYAVDSRFNAVPSFHVMYTAIILLAFIDVATPKLRAVWVAWFILICVSTVLTHRHQLIDVASGLAIAVAVRMPVRAAAYKLPSAPLHNDGEKP